MFTIQALLPISRSRRFCLTLLAFVLVSTAHAVTLPTPERPIPPVPAPPPLKAKAYVLMDQNSGQFLVQHAADQRKEPASLTKMMTMYVIDQALKQGNIKLTDNVLVSKKAWRAQGSRMFIEVGHKVSVADLIRGIIIQSGNDASIAMAEHVAGSEAVFVQMMNAQAKALGMHATHFANATGLPMKNHYTTAHDIALLARAIVHDFPESYALYSQKRFTYNGISQFNRNRLLWRNATVDGIKTGHTQSAGYCLVASAQKNHMRLISVLMGSPSDATRASQSQQLLAYGFRFFQSYKLYRAHDPMHRARVWMGNGKELDLGLEHDLYIALPPAQYKRLDAKIIMPDTLIAPIAKGRALGQVEVWLDKKLVLQRPLVALKSAPQGGALRRLSDYVQLSFHRLFG